MAGSIKGITIEIGGNTQPLIKALEQVNTKSRDLQSELRQVEKLLKLDPTNVALVAQKQKILTEAVENTTAKLKTLKTAEQQAQEQFKKGEISEEQYRALQREIVKTEQDLKGYETQLKEVGDESKKTADATTAIGNKADDSAKKTKGFSASAAVGFAAIAAAATAAVAVVSRVTTAIKDNVNGLAEYADDISTMSAMYRVSTDTLQEFAYASEIVDVSIETFGSSLGRLTRNINNARKGTEDQVAAFKGLGVTYEDANGTLRDTEDIFYDVIDALGRQTNETQADIYATALFGRSFQELNPLVAAGSARLRELGDEARTVGAVLSGEQLTKLNKYKDTMDKMKQQIKLASAPFVEGLIPAIKQTAELISQRLASPATQAMLQKFGQVIGNIMQKAAKAFFEFADYIAKNGDKILAVVAGIGAAFAAFKISGIVLAAKAALIALIPSLTGAAAAQTGLNVAMSANPIGAVIAGIAALVAVLGVFISSALKADEETRQLTEASDNLVDSMKQGAVDFADTTASIAAQGVVAGDLVGKLDALTQKAKLTAAEQAQMRVYVDQLNSIYPDLNLVIDENTGKLNKNTAEITKSVAAMKAQAEQQATMERIKQLSSDVANAQLQLAENEYKRSELLKGLTAEEKKQVSEMAKLSILFVQAPEEYREIINSVRDLDKADKELNETMVDSQENLDTYNTDGVVEANEAAAASVELITDAEAQRLIQMQENGETLSAQQTQQLEMWQANTDAELTAQAEAEEKRKALLEARVAMATDAFNRINQGEAQSVQSMMDNLNANAEAMNAWADNMAVLAGSGLDKGFLQELRDKGTEAGATVAAMVKYMTDTGDTSFAEFNAALKNAAAAGVRSVDDELTSDEATRIGSDMMDANAAGVDENEALDESVVQQVIDAKAAMNTQVIASRFQTIGASIMTDIISGLKESKAAMIAVAKEIANSLKAALTIRGTVSATGGGSTAAINVRWYGNGGVFYAPSVIGVGEAGTEVVSPLSTLENIITNSIQRTINNAPEIHIQLNVRELNKAQTDYFVETVSRRLVAGV